MRKCHGFTLLELSVVLGIICLVVIAAAPIHSWIQRQGTGLATEQLRGDLQMARLMAISRKQTCSIVVNAPSKNQYLNSLNRQCVDLDSYRGGVHFLQRGPDGKPASDAITFNRRGMAISLGSIYLADDQMSDIYRVRVMTPGGISIYRWSGDGWQ
ncbi:GspH/FimT family pseudopilin [Desulfatitalea tepidiphila]|uniref:GspH/FimT family pseudopilin n=1 Tax=Desulfatitalea tepidiphila TaxID=1185843 RepID=UPI0006B5F2A4|nr:GspH/FimT family pseudopilin [Desulfatitalea tepidiphila]